MMRVICIVQARMGSSRLPGKSMMPLGGKPLLQNVLERIQASKLIDKLIMATSELAKDDILIELSEKLGVATYRGHETDLVERYYKCAEQNSADIVVRIPADNPLIDPQEIDRGIQYFLDHPQLDFVNNLDQIMDSKYPDGLGAEVLPMRVLKWVHENIDDPFHREHVTSYIRQNLDKFQVASPSCPKQWQRPDIVLDVNTEADYTFIKQLYDDLSKPGKLIHIEEIIPWYDSCGVEIKDKA